MTTPSTAEVLAGFGMDEAMLRQIIDGTQQYLEQMDGVNTNVSTQASAILSVNTSDSGQILQGRLNQWAEEFGQIRGALQDLNNKVVGIRDLGAGTSDDATATANG